jgi:prepilin-type N-terminal cleavage/methylation domain-containing protein
MNSRPGTPSRTAWPDDRREAGFTLVELLLATTILAVIVLALGTAIISYIKHTEATADRLALSHDAQISSAHFARDVASTGRRDYTNIATGGAAPFLPSMYAGRRMCGDNMMPYAIVEFVSDRWPVNGSTPSGTDNVAYYLDGTELHRLTCGVADSDSVLAHHVEPASVALTCSITVGCNGAKDPQRVTLTFSVTRPNADPYQISLIGQWRETP